MIRNNCVVFNIYFVLFFSFLPFKNLLQSWVLVIIFLDRALFIKDIWLFLAYFCLCGAWIFNILLHASRKLFNPFTFSSIFTIPYSDNKSFLNQSFFKIFVVSIIHYLYLKSLKGYLHNSDCCLVKIRQTCFNYTRVWETSRFISQNKVNTRMFLKQVGSLLKQPRKMFCD